MHEPVFIALGTNLGCREANLKTALALLAPEVKVLRKSAVYQTAPWGFEDQPDFLNQVIEVRTQLDPQALLKKLKGIEAEMGRQKTCRYGPRLIDLDVLFFGNRDIQTENLQIPHPRLHERAFVLVPLCDLAPDFIHPVLNQTVATLAERVPAEDVKRQC